MNRRVLLSTFVLALVVLVPRIGLTALEERSHRGRKYLLFEPDQRSTDEPRPLLVMLHGCTQTPRGFARATGMNDEAEQHDAVVIYPKQTKSANQRRCWNWFQPAHTRRGNGEARLIAGMTRSVLDELNIDPERVYLAGFSAGGAMVPNLLVAYPDLFAAGGIHSGLQYRAASSVKGALSAMNGGGPDPVKQGRKAYRAMGERVRPVPTMVIHGSEDTIVDPLNGRQATRQAVETIKLAANDRRADSPQHYQLNSDPSIQTRRHSPEYTVRRRTFRFNDGRLPLVHLTIEGMGHAWAGGRAGGSHVAPDAPNANKLLWSFFNRHTKSAVDGRINTAPAVRLEAERTTIRPGDTLTIRANVSDIDGRVRSLTWTVNGQTETNGRARTVRFSKPGSRRIQVTAVDNDGAESTRSLVLSVVQKGNDETNLPEF